MNSVDDRVPGAVLGLTTIAEGVETPVQAERLRELGCDLAQGRLFAHPVDLEGLMSLLAA